MQTSEDVQKNLAIFHPHMFEEWTRANNEDVKFVHYTNAEAAISILQHKEVWMRNVSCMNDFSEVQHGLELLVDAWKNPDLGQRLQNELNNLFPNLSSELQDLFNGWSHDFRFKSYVSCVSEHLTREDELGRLSMWRAYGRSTGVAIVMNNTAFLTPSDVLRAYTSPVLYADRDKFQAYFGKIVGNIESNRDGLQVMGRDAVRDRLFNALRFSVLCTKHRGFEEEKEWRVLYTPRLDRSDRIFSEIRTIQNTPQTIYKIPLGDIEGVDGISIPKLIHRIIVGPSEYAFAVRDAFVDLFERQGLTDSNNRVWVSGIPLR